MTTKNIEDSELVRFSLSIVVNPWTDQISFAMFATYQAMNQSHASKLLVNENSDSRTDGNTNNQGGRLGSGSSNKVTNVPHRRKKDGLLNSPYRRPPTLLESWKQRL